MTRYLGLDIGNRRIGVAVGNSELRLATPLAVIERRALERDVVELERLAVEYEADKLVVGLPRNTDGSLGPQAEATMRYAAALGAALQLPLEYADERYSTQAALARQRQMGVPEKQGRATVDAAAAVIILQDFLDQKSEGE